MTTPLSKASLFQYGFLALPLAFAGLPLYIHAPDFYTRDLGLSLGLIGAILLFIRLFDAVQDPIIGYLSDKYPHQRHNIIMGGIILLIVGISGIFHGDHSPISLSIWFTLSMILATTGFSILAINLTIIGGLWSDNKNERTRISSWREAFGLVGLLIASIIPTLFSYDYLIVTFMALVGVAYYLFVNFLKDNPVQNNKKNATISFSFLKILFGQDKLFFTICFITHIAAAIPAVMVLFFINDYLQAESLQGLFLLLYFLSGALFMPFWAWSAALVGKYHTWMGAMILSIAAFSFAYTLQSGDIVTYGIICVLSGIALGGNLSLPPSILADRISKKKQELKATQYYAALAFLPKIAIAIASGGTFLILNHYSFMAGTENTEHTQTALIIMYALVPCFIKLIAVGLLWRSEDFKGEKDEKINERINAHERSRIS